MTKEVLSSRRLTKEVGRFTRVTPGSQSLERGLQILRAFRLGIGELTNAELARRTGLPRPTVSRLTRSLVDAGFLSYDLQLQAYRLGAVTLSLSQAFRYGLPVLEVALPLMRKVAEGEQINVGLAVPDQLEMVYLESARESRMGIFRRLSAGSRIPIELTSLGRAYLSGLPKPERQQLLGRIAQQHDKGWPALLAEINRGVMHIKKNGYCQASWQTGVIAIAAPLPAPDQTLYALNISFPIGEKEAENSAQVKRYAQMLLRLKEQILETWRARIEAVPL
ncbi:IclR family transcriptional regulator [Ottowia thiooxydans]|uniref:IclR family transcriptional regulator n=1 Tax=Ottowia thiooxydans TaxID=219182 RepID=UPI0003FB4DD0|nr:IclR family transcriptional regulator [Ottowia thiooxydans]